MTSISAHSRNVLSNFLPRNSTIYITNPNLSNDVTNILPSYNASQHDLIITPDIRKMFEVANLSKNNILNLVSDKILPKVIDTIKQKCSKNITENFYSNLAPNVLLNLCIAYQKEILPIIINIIGEEWLSKIEPTSITNLHNIVKTGIWDNDCISGRNKKIFAKIAQNTQITQLIIKAHNKIPYTKYNIFSMLVNIKGIDFLQGNDEDIQQQLENLDKIMLPYYNDLNKIIECFTSSKDKKILEILIKEHIDFTLNSSNIKTNQPTTFYALIAAQKLNLANNIIQYSQQMSIDKESWLTREGGANYAKIKTICMHLIKSTK